MFIINTKTDLERLNAIGWIPPSVKSSVKELFEGLREALHMDDQPDDSFSVCLEGTIAVLEPTDRLSAIFEQAPSGVEYAETFTTEPNQAYRVGVMHDNDRMNQYIVLVDTLNEEDKGLLEQMVWEGGCGQ